MTHDTPYRVEVDVKANGRTRYAIHHSGEGKLCSGKDSVLMHHICDLLNEEKSGLEAR